MSVYSKGVFITTWRQEIRQIQEELSKAIESRDKGDLDTMIEHLEAAQTIIYKIILEVVEAKGRDDS